MSDQYTEDLKINEHDLEGEWLTQASKYMFYSDKHAVAVTNRDKAKLEAEKFLRYLTEYI